MFKKQIKNTNPCIIEQYKIDTSEKIIQTKLPSTVTMLRKPGNLIIT